MKKYLKLFILVFVCFLPVIVDAKTSLTYEWKVSDKDYITTVDNLHYFMNGERVNVYDNVGNMVLENYVVDYDKIVTLDDAYNDEFLTGVLKFQLNELKYNTLLKKYYSIDYKYWTFYIYGDMVDDSPIYLDLDDEENLVEAQVYLGKEYDVLTKVWNDGLTLERVSYEEGYYVVWCYDNNSDYDFYRIYDENLNLIYNSKFLYYEKEVVHVYNNKIYVMKDLTKINIYDMEGNLLESLNIYNDLNKVYPDFNLNLNYFSIEDDSIFVDYYLVNPRGIDGVSGSRNTDVRDNARSEIADSENIVFKFKISYEVKKIDSSNGSFTYDRIINEDGDEIVQLRIEPKDGYVVDEIIVTDVNGERIEVTDNKFYMPSSDVIVEVKYKGGEYLPIPDTGLGRNLTIVLISLILIGLGFYTINYVKREN